MAKSNKAQGRDKDGKFASSTVLAEQLQKQKEDQEKALKEQNEKLQKLAEQNEKLQAQLGDFVNRKVVEDNDGKKAAALPMFTTPSGKKKAFTAGIKKMLSACGIIDKEFNLLKKQRDAVVAKLVGYYEVIDDPKFSIAAEEYFWEAAECRGLTPEETKEDDANTPLLANKFFPRPEEGVGEEEDEEDEEDDDAADQTYIDTPLRTTFARSTATSSGSSRAPKRIKLHNNKVPEGQGQDYHEFATFLSNCNGCNDTQKRNLLKYVVQLMNGEGIAYVRWPGNNFLAGIHINIRYVDVDYLRSALEQHQQTYGHMQNNQSKIEPIFKYLDMWKASIKSADTTSTTAARRGGN